MVLKKNATSNEVWVAFFLSPTAFGRPIFFNWRRELDCRLSFIKNVGLVKAERARFIKNCGASLLQMLCLIRI